jgi:hypothetical protein
MEVRAAPRKCPCPAVTTKLGSSLPCFGPAPPLPQLENAEARWKGLKKKILNRREALVALQQTEAVDVRRQGDAFSERVEEYRK